MISLIVFLMAVTPTSHPSLDDLDCVEPGSVFAVNEQGLGCQGKEIGIEFSCKADKVLIWACESDLQK